MSKSSPWAICFPIRLENSLARLKKDRPDKVKVDTYFTGFDAYEQVLNAGVDLVILATPPHFRPQHLTAAINAGKHVFMEKPVAVDPVGVRKVIAAAELAGQKGLGIVCGTQRRHDPVYVETMDRILNGAIGEVVGGQCYWNMGALWLGRGPGQLGKISKQRVDGHGMADSQLAVPDLAFG